MRAGGVAGAKYSLIEYAKVLRVQTRVKELIGVWL